jgi:hypothetical protein
VLKNHRRAARLFNTFLAFARTRACREYEIVALVARRGATNEIASIANIAIRELSSF